MLLKASPLYPACAVLALSLCTAGLQAQQPATTPDAVQPSEPTLVVRDDKALESFEPGVNEEYTLGAGDEISLEFPGRPELTSTGKQTIGPDGRITLPL